MSDTKMKITIFSAISTDGFEIDITQGPDIIFHDCYHYGYSVTHIRELSKPNTPYVTELLTGLCSRFNVAPENIKVIAGKNEFKGIPVDYFRIEDFKIKFLSEVYLWQ